MISAYASLPQYARHLRPIVEALRARGEDVTMYAKHHWQEWGPTISEPSRLGDLVLVASHTDAQAMWARRVVYVEHGAGQTYVDGTRMGYAGGPGLDNVVLFLAPNVHVAKRWAHAYPNACSEVIGCPLLAGVGRYRDEPMQRERRAFWTMHWRCDVNPETYPAHLHHERAIDPLRAYLDSFGIELVGHGHPREHRRTPEFWTGHGVRYEPDPDVVLAQASLLIADNTSLMYEAAALGIPVVALNRPEYRRDVEHGLRFWSHVPGLQCDEPADLIDVVREADADPPAAVRLRNAAAARAYAAVHQPAATAARFVLEAHR